MPENKDRDLDASLGDQNTLPGEYKPKIEDLETRSLGDQVTFGGGAEDGQFEDGGIEIVDLAARYKIEKTLGKGGVGEVLLATDTRLDRKVAIKRIVGDAARSKTSVNRFLTEAKSIAALSHPNVVQIYDYGRTQDGPFLIMEFVDGSSLLDRCREGALPLDEAVDLACQLCDGLGRAHEIGIVHRDIKPANVLLTADGIPKLTDFGLAKAESADTGMTMAGAVLGTLDFMPPEQRRDAALSDARSDLWSLAATLYQMVTGESPKVIRIKKVPLQLQDVLDKALEDSKESRYQTAKDLLEALRNCMKEPRREVPQPPADLGAGECSSCHSINESHRKFCRECGDPLRCKCLKCQHEIPVWDKICPECGGKQKEFIVAKLQEIESQCKDAQQQVKEGEFQVAIKIAQGITNIDDRRFNQRRSWAIDFVESTKTEWERQKEFARQHFAEAKKHREVFDYDAAIHAIETIPKPLRTLEIDEYLQRLYAEKLESTTLIDKIKARVRERTIDGLLTLVDRAVFLRGDRIDLKKLLEQLRERELKHRGERDEAFALADFLLWEGKVREAYQTIKSIDVSCLTADQVKLREKLGQLLELEKEIASMVKLAKADGIIDPHETLALFPKVNIYVQNNPEHAVMNKLRSDLIELLEKVPIEELSKLPLDELLTLPYNIQGRVLITNSIGMKLKLIQAGTFMMGASSDAHRVTLTKPFYLGVYAVTQEEYYKITGKKPSNGPKRKLSPVTDVSWFDAMEFCDLLSLVPEEKASRRAYRLPSEPEWEYACRAGSRTRFCFGDDESLLGEYAWFRSNSRAETHLVGTRKPNAWGLYDMHGNVNEWCLDVYAEYPKESVTDPDPYGPDDGTSRVIRGGSWFESADVCQSVSRQEGEESDCDDHIGFRVAMTVDGMP